MLYVCGDIVRAMPIFLRIESPLPTTFIQQAIVSRLYNIVQKSTLPTEHNTSVLTSFEFRWPSTIGRFSADYLLLCVHSSQVERLTENLFPPATCLLFSSSYLTVKHGGTVELQECIYVCCYGPARFEEEHEVRRRCALAANAKQQEG